MAARVAVIGGGISGLAAAYRLSELARTREFPLEVTLFEAGARVGGPLETVRREGLVMETGADAFLSEKPEALALAERIGLGGRLVRTREALRRTLVVRAGRLVEVPEGFALMAPTYLGPVLLSPLFSLKGKLRMLLEPLLPRRRADGDESLAAFVTRRLGVEVLERVAQPLAAGIYTGDPYHLSVAATMPRFVEMERRYGSVILGLRAAARQAAEKRGVSGARWSLFVSLAGGMGELVEALRERLGATLRVGAEVQELRREGVRWRIAVGGEALTADAVICTVPAYAAARLLEPVAPVLAAELRPVRYASAVVINLAYAAAALPALPSGFGFVVPAIERRKIIAGSFSSLKFAGRAPAGIVLLRVFLGGALQAHLAELDEAALVAAAREELSALLGITAAPQVIEVRRWPEAMPQYAVGHRHRVASIRKRLTEVPGLFLAGAYLDGVGIPDCVRQGEAAAGAALAAVMGV